MLASQGYATVSVRVNGINAQDYRLDDGGADARAQIVEAHLDHWVDLAAAHQVDLSRVVLVGHSRGGEGVNRASIQIPLSAPYRIVGQVLIAPTDFGSQTAPYVPTVTLLPFCDGDVSDLQGQKFTDTARDLASDDTSLKSSVLVMGADHNFFNTEWTPGIAAAPASDDWYGAKDSTCGSDDPERLSPDEQQDVGTAYVAGAVHLFADDDQAMLPLFDGSRARVASQGAAQTLSHAVGGGRDLRLPGLTTGLSLASGAQTRFCQGVTDQQKISSCAYGVDYASVHPHWPESYEKLPTRPFFQMTWTATGQSGGLVLDDPLDLTGRSLELRTIVDPRSTDVDLRVRITDSQGGSALLTPVGGGTLPSLGDTPDTEKLWAQTLVVDPAAASGVDLTRHRPGRPGLCQRQRPDLDRRPGLRRPRRCPPYRPSGRRPSTSPTSASTRATAPGRPRRRCPSRSSETSPVRPGSWCRRPVRRAVTSSGSPSTSPRARRAGASRSATRPTSATTTTSSSRRSPRGRCAA